MYAVSAHILLAALLATTTAVGAPTDTQQLKELEQRWMTAGTQRDTATLKDVLADDFVDITYQGKLRDKADHLKSSLAPSKSKQSLEELKVRIYGDTGIVNGLNVVVTQDGSATYMVRFTDVFVKRKGVWRAVSAQETLEKNP